MGSGCVFSSQWECAGEAEVRWGEAIQTRENGGCERSHKEKEIQPEAKPRVNESESWFGFQVPTSTEEEAGDEEWPRVDLLSVEQVGATGS